MKIRKKPVVVETDGRWFQQGDNDDVFRFYPAKGDELCKECDQPLSIHGQIDTEAGGYTVCPGDWIIVGIKGEKHPCKHDIFRLTYDILDENGEVTQCD